MLSFEFPPFIAGGLGMVCYGLVRALTRLGSRVNLVLPVERACYFPLNEPEDTDAPSAVFLEGNSGVFSSAVLGARVLFQSLGLQRHPGSYSRGYPYAVQHVPAEWRCRERGTGAAGRWSEAQGNEAQRSKGAAEQGRGGIFETMESYLKLVRKVLHAAAFDLIHAHDWVTFPAALEARALSGKPLLVHVHSTEYDRSPSSPDPRICSLEEQGLREADLIAAVSSLQAQSLVKRYAVPEAKIRVVHNAVRGAPPDRETDPVSGGRRWPRTLPEPVVLFLGRITEQKGAMDFLAVAAKVHREIPEARFIMAGEGDQTAAILETADRLGLQGALSLTGFLERDGVAKMLSSTDVLLFPSISDPFGISPLEAMSYGVSVVLTNQSGVSELVRNVVKCEAGDVDAMASAVVELIKDPGKRRALGERAAVEAGRLRWTEAALETEAAYRELLALTKRRR